MQVRKWMITLHFVTVAEFLRKSIFGDLKLFVASGQGKHAMLIGTTRFCIGYPENAEYALSKNSLSNHKIVRKLAYLSVKMASLNQKHN